MVSKCSNPNCSAEFMYLGDGKLFEFESASSRATRDFHWLCNECAKSLKLHRREDGEIILVRVDQADQDELAA
jgi:hypothetical protein